MDLFVDLALLAMLAVTAVAIVRVRSLLSAAMLAGIYSFLTAGLFVVMDAVDVAFTESAVGAGVSTILMLLTMTFVGHEEKKPVRRFWLPLGLVTVTGLVLSYGMLDMPPYGNPDNPVHQHVAPRYLEDSPEEIGVPNVVTSVLASYRGYDTMGETAVVFTALVGVLILLGGRPPRNARVETDPPDPDTA